MAHAGRGGNTSLVGAWAGGESAGSLLIAALFLWPFVIFKMPQEDRRKRGIRRAGQDIADMVAVGAATLAAVAIPIVIY